MTFSLFLNLLNRFFVAEFLGVVFRCTCHGWTISIYLNCWCRELKCDIVTGERQMEDKCYHLRVVVFSVQKTSNRWRGPRREGPWTTLIRFIGCVISFLPSQYEVMDASIRIPQRIYAIKRKDRLEIELNCIVNLQDYKYLTPRQVRRKITQCRLHRLRRKTRRRPKDCPMSPHQTSMETI